MNIKLKFHTIMIAAAITIDISHSVFASEIFFSGTEEDDKTAYGHVENLHQFVSQKNYVLPEETKNPELLANLFYKGYLAHFDSDKQKKIAALIPNLQDLAYTHDSYVDSYVYVLALHSDNDLSQEFVNHIECEAYKQKAWAQYCLGMMCEQGRGVVAKDYGKAVACYDGAAQKGMGQAQYSLAIMYQEPVLDGLKKNLNRSLELLESAGNNRSRLAQHRLAVMYTLGIDVEADIQESLKWLNHLIKVKDDYYQSSLGTLREIIGMQKNVEQYVSDSSKTNQYNWILSHMSTCSFPCYNFSSIFL